MTAQENGNRTFFYGAGVGISKREHIATELHKALLLDRADYADERREGESCPQATARIAVEHADALLERLAK